MLAASAAQAQSLLRDTSHFQWGILPVFLLVLYVYNEQIAERRWSVVLAGIAFWLMDWVNEIWNGLIAHFSGFAPVWGTPNGSSSLVLLIGLNLEISLMFAVMGLMAVRMLPPQRELKILGVPNRLLLAVVNSILCVLVECWLNHIGVLTWAWSGWGLHAPWLIFLIGYLPFFLVAYWVHDMPSRIRQIKVVAGLAGGVVSALLIFGFLGWI
ncbi:MULTISPECIES: hypothetical protein [unclassified Paludibacterium]|uniref:hypothetical protein n=1 Tax=unclassified Paludibacterium TaxID=2618429 RepID=UPI001C0510D6|nr:hypothetical protein [Paludibacterium sp. B53371]BEV73521.1 hypothetical protein THUN1379_30030 [Paludibacterium sp. THUN1379]